MNPREAMLTAEWQPPDETGQPATTPPELPDAPQEAPAPRPAEVPPEPSRPDELPQSEPD
jgi:hypothetical protein